MYFVKEFFVYGVFVFCYELLIISKYFLALTGVNISILIQM